MEILFIQLTRHPQFFGLFYSLAFLVVLFVLIVEGNNRKIPLLQWMLILTFSRILFIIGTKLFAFSFHEWQFMAENLKLVPGTNKVVFGGLLLGTIGLLVGKYWMRINRPLSDAFALALPLGMAIQRLGCFFAGCCHGTPSNVFWATKYPIKTLPHYHHYQQSLIGDTDLYSFPVHPAPLYEVFGAILVVFAVLYFRKRWKSPGSSFIFSLSLFMLVRFLVEFFRDPLAHTAGGTIVGSLNLIQWVIAVLLVVFVPILIFREKNPKETKSLLPIPSPSPASVILLFGLSVFIIMIFANWFVIFELLAMLMVLGFALFLTVVHIFRNRQQPVYRITYVLLLAVPLIYIGFSFTRLQSDSTQIRKTLSVGVGYSSGNFENRGRKYEGEDENCGPYYSSTYFRQRYSLKGVQFNLKYDYLEQNYSTNFGLNIYGGIHSEKPLDNNLRNVWNDYNIFVVNPSFRFDKEWFGAGVGIHIGNMSYVTYNSKANSGESARKLMNYYSMFSYRIGPKNILYCEYRLADWFPSAFPSYRHQFSIGSGFGSTNGFDVKVGTTFQWIYISSEIPIKNRFTVTPLLLFNKSFNGDDQTQFSMALKYAFIRKEIKVPVAQNH